MSFKNQFLNISAIQDSFEGSEVVDTSATGGKSFEKSFGGSPTQNILGATIKKAALI